MAVNTLTKAIVNQDWWKTHVPPAMPVRMLPINPAIAHGVSKHIGSIEKGKLADLVLWTPAFFGVKPDIVIKGGSIAAAHTALPILLDRLGQVVLDDGATRRIRGSEAAAVAAAALRAAPADRRRAIKHMEVAGLDLRRKFLQGTNVIQDEHAAAVRRDQQASHIVLAGRTHRLAAGAAEGSRRR